jgi:tetratricopeptide (TPR) repeat protein
MQDLFALQDDITLNILKALQVALTEGDIGAVRPTNDSRSLDAYLLYWQAVEHYRRFNREDNVRARQLAMRANELDPQFAQAAALVGWSHQMDGRFGWSDSRAKSYLRGAEIAGRALQLDPEHPSVQALLSNVYLSQRKFEDAVAAGRKSIALAPSASVFYANTAVATYYAGNFEETVTLTKEAMRLHPYYPAWYDYRIGVAYRMLGQYDEAVTALTANKGRRAKPNMLALTALAATYSMMGRLADGRAGVKETLKLHPNASVQAVAKMHYFKDAAHLERILDALRKVGLPE